MSAWSIAMLASGGLFAVVAGFFAWVRIPAWRAMSWPEFQPDFARSIRRADILQPALLVVSVVSTLGFASTTQGLARTLSLVSAAGFLLILAISAAILVPIQRRLVKGSADEVTLVRRRWYRGHFFRTAIALSSVALAAVAAAV